VRLEAFEAMFNRYGKADEVVWVQEEPKNMGAYRHIEAVLREQLDIDLPYVGRDPSATPAVASFKMHQQEQQRLLINAIGLASEGGVPSTPEAREAEQASLVSTD
jgi:2-oxoglutarate dehydrogenase E1 component